MSLNIHPTAIVHPKAQLDDGVSVGPYSIIDEHVVIGEGTVIGNPQPPYPFNMTMITCVDFNITIGSSTQEIQLCDVVMTPHVFNGIIQNPNTAAVISTQQGTIE